MYLIFDTETTGLPRNWNAPITDTENWPRCIQIAWQLHDSMGDLLEQSDFLVQPEGFDIPYDAEKIHGISTDLAAEQGGNSAFSEAGKINTVDGIKIIGVKSLMNRLPLTASSLYAKNLFSFIRNLYSKDKKDFNINLDDEIIEKSLIKKV